MEVVANFDKVALTTGGKDGATVVSPMSLAAGLPLDVWRTCIPAVRIVWQVKWAPAGMMPVRPVIATLTSVTVPPKKALKLWVD